MADQIRSLALLGNDEGFPEGEPVDYENCSSHGAWPLVENLREFVREVIEGGKVIGRKALRNHSDRD